MSMDDTMEMIKAGLGLTPTEITPEYLLKTFYKGYNQGIDDVLRAVDKAYSLACEVTTKSLENSDIDDVNCNICQAICNVLLDTIVFDIKQDINYKELK